LRRLRLGGTRLCRRRLLLIAVVLTGGLSSTVAAQRARYHGGDERVVFDTPVDVHGAGYGNLSSPGAMRSHAPKSATVVASLVPVPIALVPGEKSPVLAWVLSFVLPGAGQGYNGQWGKAAAFFGGVVAGSTLVVVGAVSCVVNAAGGEDCGGYDAVWNIGLVLMLGSWVWSQIDAPVSAIGINRRLRERAVLDLGPRVVVLPVSRTRHPAPSIGLELGRVLF
jgi:hypothetical protein